MFLCPGLQSRCVATCWQTQNPSMPPASSGPQESLISLWVFILLASQACVLSSKTHLFHFTFRIQSSKTLKFYSQRCHVSDGRLYELSAKIICHLPLRMEDCSVLFTGAFQHVWSVTVKSQHPGLTQCQQILFDPLAYSHKV